MPTSQPAARQSAFHSRLFARPLDDVGEFAQHREILTETAHLLLEDIDPDSLCHAVFERLRKPYSLDAYFHYLMDEDGQHLLLASAGGSPEVRDHIGLRLEMGQLVCGLVAVERREHCVLNVQDRTDERTSLIRSLGIRTHACFPLIARDRVLGTLSFGSKRRTSFDEEELELFRLIAQQVTLATDRRVRIEHLRQLEQLAAIGRMHATLAHEINNPLESLSSLLYILRDEVHGPEAQDLLHRAESQVARLSEVSIRTLESFRGSMQSPSKVDLSELLDQLACDILLPHHTRLDRTVEPGLCVTAIAGELRQVFFNLLLNAGNYTPPGEPVTLTARRDGSHVEVRVRDEGQGISDESAKHVFEPFYTTRRTYGTGVGLWLSKELIGHSDGTITFESNPRVRPGTEFVVRLPIAA